jgi:hypothetical protein
MVVQTFLKTTIDRCRLFLSPFADGLTLVIKPANPG